MSDTIAKLRELLLQQSKTGRLRGLLDSIYGAASTGAEAYGSASSPMSAEHSGLLGGLLMDMSPLGDAKSAYDGVQSAREGDYLGAGLGALGALPMVPNLAGSLGRVSPEIIKAIGSDEPAVLASKVKGLLSSNLSRQRSLNQRISREDISDSDRLLLNGDLIKTEEGIKKLHGWLTELEPPINHSNHF